jgi:hypothetical protein
MSAPSCSFKPLRKSTKNEAAAGIVLPRQILRPVGRQILSEDAIGVEAGMNLYPYVSNTPTQFVDHYGLFSLDLSETWTRSSEPWCDPTEWDVAQRKCSHA